MRGMTVGQLMKMAEAHKYVILRYRDFTIATNTSFPSLAVKRRGTSYSQVTEVMSYRPCTFQEYISRKVIIINKTKETCY